LLQYGSVLFLHPLIIISALQTCLTISLNSMVDYRGNVIVEGTGKIVGFTDDNTPIVVSCGLYFTIYLPDKATFIPIVDDAVFI